MCDIVPTADSLAAKVFSNKAVDKIASPTVRAAEVPDEIGDPL